MDPRVAEPSGLGMRPHGALRGIAIAGALALLSGASGLGAVVAAGRTADSGVAARTEGPSASSTSSRLSARTLLRGLPLAFVPNLGQADPRVSYYVQGTDTSLYFTSNGLTLALSAPRPRAGLAPKSRGS